MKKTAATALLALVLAGCNTATKATPENYLAAINRYLPDHRDCLLDGTIRFPYETSEPAMLKKMDALVKAKVLESSREPAIKVSRYKLTPAGTAATPNLCFGYREATAIVDSTTPAPANGFTESRVTYRYALRDEPIWAKTPEVMEAYPILAREKSGTATDTLSLALNRTGWAVAD